MPSKVMAVMIVGLNAPYSEDEVKTTLFQMLPTKASGQMAYQHNYF
jgi:hypothetical protein